MEEIINKFNEIIQQADNAVAEAKSPEEAEKLQSQWDKKIDVAEAQMQKDLEAFIKAEDDALLTEQKQTHELLEKEQDKVEKKIKEKEKKRNANNNKRQS